jgi:hypothetical protein
MSPAVGQSAADTATQAALRYVPGDVNLALDNMLMRDDEMAISLMGKDGVYRVIGFHPPDFWEPYVLDYRHLDPSQIAQYHEQKAALHGEEVPWDEIKNTDGRCVTSKKQIFEPEEFGWIRERYRQLPAEVRRPATPVAETPATPLNDRAAAAECCND